MFLKPPDICPVEINFLAGFHNLKIGVDRLDQDLLLRNAVFGLGHVCLDLPKFGIFPGLSAIIEIA